MSAIVLDEIRAREAALASQSRRLALIGIGAAVLVIPFVVPLGAGLVRGLFGILCCTIAIKLYDVQVASAVGETPSVRRFVTFMLNPLALVERRLNASPRPCRRSAIRRLTRGVIVATAGMVPLLYCWDELAAGPFVLEHTAKIVLAFIGAAGVSDVVAGTWYRAGGRGPHWHDNYFAAVTPADFWRRYNRPVREFFEHDVFRRAGWRQNRPWAISLAFAVSGLLHEYLAVLGCGRIYGYWLVFFLVQGVAVTITFRARPRGEAARAAARLATILFMLGSSTLFVAGANQFIGWYSSSAPTWLAPQAPRP